MVFIRSHPVFEVPPADQVLWRYMDLARFLAILQTSTLWLARLDLLGDPHEGALGQLNRRAGRTAPDDEESYRRRTFVSCWHMNERESAAMWGLYQKEGRGIALRSTVGALEAALGDTDGFNFGAVHYVDYARTEVPEYNVVAASVYKRLSFEHEREVRLIAMEWPTLPHDPHLVDEASIPPRGWPCQSTCRR